MSLLVLLTALQKLRRFIYEVYDERDQREHLNGDLEGGNGLKCLK